MSENKAKANNGHCLCGAVKFTVVGEPIYNVICHCENCRRQGGSTFHCASIYLKSQYTLHAPPSGSSQNISTYLDHATDSTVPLHRSFCAACGSKVCATTALNDAIVSIPAGVLEDAGHAWTAGKEQFCDVRCAMWADRALGGEGGLGGKEVKERFKRGPTREGVAKL